MVSVAPAVTVDRVCEVPSVVPFGPHLPVLLTQVLRDICVPRSWVEEEIVGDGVEVVHVLFSLLL